MRTLAAKREQLATSPALDLKVKPTLLVIPARPAVPESPQEHPQTPPDQTSLAPPDFAAEGSKAGPEPAR